MVRSFLNSGSAVLVSALSLLPSAVLLTSCSTAEPMSITASSAKAAPMTTMSGKSQSNSDSIAQVNSSNGQNDQLKALETQLQEAQKKQLQENIRELEAKLAETKRAAEEAARLAALQPVAKPGVQPGAPNAAQTQGATEAQPASANMARVVPIARSELMNAYRANQLKETDTVIVTLVTDPNDVAFVSKNSEAARLTDYVEFVPSYDWWVAVCKNPQKAASDVQLYVPADVRSKTVIISTLNSIPSVCQVQIGQVYDLLRQQGVTAPRLSGALVTNPSYPYK